MEGVCPGLKYLNELSVPIEQDTNSVYMMFGHGCDLKQEVWDVPHGCEYYTVTACGISASPNPKLNKDFFNNTLDLTKPEIYTYYEDQSITDPEYPLIQYSGEQNLYKRKSGESYVNNMAYPFNGLGNYSGLRKMGSIISNNIPIDSYYTEPNFITRGLQINYSKENRPYTLELYYLQHFTGSIFPTTSQVCKLLHENFTENELNSFNYSYFKDHTKFQDLIYNNFRIDYTSIMKVFKGRFINASCRPICKGPLTKSEIIPVDSFTAERRRISAILPFQWNEYDEEE
jgi:hypothetical protein